jgi:hypothetical protein
MNNEQLRVLAATDPAFETYYIDKVVDIEDAWELTLRELDDEPDTGYTCFWLKKENCPKDFVPEKNQPLRSWGGFGRPIRGIEIAGSLLYYETEETYAARQKVIQAKEDTEDKRKYEESGKAENDARIALLPPVFQERIADFRRRREDFGWKREAYELFTCEQAVLISQHVKVDDMEAFHKLEWHQQRTVVPGLDEGHSGNTFGAACMLAKFYLTQPNLVPKFHAAICPLLGCDTCGCFSTEAKGASYGSDS